MNRRLREETAHQATRHLRRNDPRLAAVMELVGPFRLVPDRNRLKMLVRSIISQQISTSAARTIRGRLEEQLGRRFDADDLLNLTTEQARAIGLSAAKARYVRDLAEHVVEGRLALSKIGRLDDEAVIRELTQVKGIGRWTAQMFLIFSLGRWDVLPVDDLGVRAAIRRIYELPELPGRDECEQIGASWRPYATVASWYCWRSGDVVPE